jgi:site-specific DNA-cytosine methylase
MNDFHVLNIIAPLCSIFVGQTFFAMLDWVQKAQPPIVIIENVCNAPWPEKIKKFDDIGYSATFQRADSKMYYVPHTRNRGYLVAVLRSSQSQNQGTSSPKRKAAHPLVLAGNTNRSISEMLEKWTKTLKDLRRPASATLDDILLSKDDPRVLRGRARLTNESRWTNGNVRRTDWSKCEVRHQAVRVGEELGTGHPFTDWSDNADTCSPDFAWNDWINVQVHRIHDLIDINTLRMAASGMDCTFKTMVWNLSQNCDRDTMGNVRIFELCVVVSCSVSYIVLGW